ncbi:MAG: FliA/WhiG family RNA polymerase sigma factor [Clostridiales bacterium]|nr:FliA/WhiG family RNA polymerase sigma factor [Clostridiales bacterium]
MVDKGSDNLKLWKQYKNQNSAYIRNLLFSRYNDLAIKIALSVAPKYKNFVHIDDLKSFASIGLLDAIEKFDIDRGIKFETYASIRIRGAIVDEIRKLDWIPRNVRQKFRLIEKAMSEIENKLGRSATTKEISEHLSIPAKEVEDILHQMNSQAIISFDDRVIELINKDTNQYLHRDEYNPEKIVTAKELRDNLATAVDYLPERERLIINLYYFEEFTLKEIGNVLDLTESRISQLHTKALSQLRESLND